MGLVKLNDRGVRSATTFGSLNTGSMTFIKKLTASSSDTLSFVDGASDGVLDDTYKEYLFTFKDIHPETDAANLQFNMSIDTGSNYNVTKTTTLFRSIHKEDDSDYNFSYRAGEDTTRTIPGHRRGSDTDVRILFFSKIGKLEWTRRTSILEIYGFVRCNGLAQKIR